MNRKLALIIGNSHYQDPNLAKLIAPSEDVNDLADVLRNLDIGGFDGVNTLVDESDATIRLSIEDFFADKKPDDLLVLYFSGHGVRDEQGRLYLAAPNTRANRLRATAIATDFITGEMDRSRSKRQVLILDCCHSGAFAQGAKAVTGESAGIGPAFEGNGYGRVVLTATDATQYAWEGDKIIGEADNSLFTHYMVEGLRTGAADVDGDGKITLDEMYDYVYEHVVTQTPKQTPGKWSYKQQGDIVIARNPKPIVKPVELPADLKMAIESPLANVRLGSVRELDRLLNGSNAGLALAAFDAIKHLADDDSRSVSSAASSALQAYAEKQRVREEQERLAKERAEQDRLAAERAEAERLAALKAERERVAAEKARQEQRAREAEHAEQERIAKERAEANRLAAIRAEQDRIAAERAESDRQAALKADTDRQAAIKAEQDRIAAEKAKQEQLAREAQRAEQERIAKERDEAERQAALQAEADRIAAERAALSPAREEVFDTARRAAVAAARLMVQGGPDVGQTFALQLGVNIIGRMSSVAIRLTDGLISRQHVRLTVEAGRVTAEDLGSANGTFLNGQRLSGNAPIALHEGDTLALGDTVLVFRSAAMAPAVQPEAPIATPLIEMQTTIAEAPPRSFADQLVADQPTRVSSVETTQSNTALAARLKAIVIPTLMAAAGFGLIFAVWLASLMGVSDFVAGATLTIAAMLLLWGVTGLMLRQMQILVAWQRVFAVGLGWAVAAGIGVGAAYVLGSSLQYGDHSPEFASTLLIISVFGAVCGFGGGQVTGRILRSAVPALKLKTTTLGWTVAWTVGPGTMLAVVWNSNDNEVLRQALALCGALIGAIGGGTMFWQIASKNTAMPVAATQQSIEPSLPAAELKTAVRAIAIICGGWVLINLLDVLVGQLAPSVLDMAAYFSVGYGAGCLVLALIMHSVLPSMKRTVWLLAGGWALVTISAVQIGVAARLDSNWLNTAGNGICGVIGAWAVLRQIPSVPHWKYGVVGVVWLAAGAIGSGYAWEIVIHQLYQGWNLASSMNELNVSVLSLVLGPVLSAVAGGALLYRLVNTASLTDYTPTLNQDSTAD
ncbi:MAG: caspase family protein [Anaerolineae bacterium]